MNVDFLLEKYLETKGIDPDKVDEDLFSTVVSRIEDDIDEYVREEVFEKFAEEWVYLEIEQKLEDHPEWKLKESVKEEDKK